VWYFLLLLKKPSGLWTGFILLITRNFNLCYGGSLLDNGNQCLRWQRGNLFPVYNRVTRLPELSWAEKVVQKFIESETTGVCIREKFKLDQELIGSWQDLMQYKLWVDPNLCERWNSEKNIRACARLGGHVPSCVLQVSRLYVVCSFVFRRSWNNFQSTILAIREKPWEKGWGHLPFCALKPTI